MNHILLGSKQVFLGTLRLTRGWLRDFGLTPARYNMMFAIATHRGGLAQKDLRGLLGVTSQTISRMLASLEDLGYIRRTPHPKNPRLRWIVATIHGLFHLRDAIEDLVSSGLLGWATDEVINPNPGVAKDAITARREVDTIFNRMRVQLSDVATLRFFYDGEYAAEGEQMIARYDASARIML